MPYTLSLRQLTLLWWRLFCGPTGTFLPRTLPVGPTRALTVGGRFGRLREPYPLRRDRERPVHLRDGDCLLLDHGPFGPPPPTPVNSKGARSVLTFSLWGYSVSVLHWHLPYCHRSEPLLWGGRKGRDIVTGRRPYSNVIHGGRPEQAGPSPLWLAHLASDVPCSVPSWGRKVGMISLLGIRICHY